MLEARVRSPQVEMDSLRQFATCHFLLCKYRMFWRVKAACGEALALSVNIQDYYHLTRMELLKYFY